MNKPCTKCKDRFDCNQCEKIQKYWLYLRKKQKYKRSDTLITSAEQLLATEWIWCWNKPVHRSIFISMPLRIVMQYIQNKSLYVAELKQKPVDQQQQT